MEIQIGADVSLDLATKQDLQDEIKQFRRDISKPYRERILAAQTLSATGVANTFARNVYDVPDGMTFFLSKYIIWHDAYNPSTGAVYTNAGAWGGIFHGIASPASLADFWPVPEASTGQVFPFTKEFNGVTSPEFRQNDNIYVQIVAPVVNAGNITVICFGELRALTLRDDLRPVTRKRPTFKANQSEELISV